MTARIYLRVSTADQADKFSLGAQEARARAWCQYEQLSDVQVYADAGISGVRDDRPGLLSLMTELQAGDTVLIYSISRLGRGGVIQLLRLVTQIRERGARLVSLTESLDMGTPAGRLTINMLASLAEMEREQMLERTDAGRTQAASQGIYPHSSASLPTGWMRGPDGRIVEDPEHAASVRLIFAEGKAPYERTARKLAALGVPTPRGAEWSIVTVRRIVLYEAYSTGIFQYRSGALADQPELWVNIPAPALVSREVWMAAQRDARQNHSHKRPDKFPLTGHLRCACGAPLQGRTGRVESTPITHNRHDSYVCYARVRKSLKCPVNGKATKVWATAPELFEHAKRVLAEYLALPHDPTGIRHVLGDAPAPADPHAAERDRLNQQLERLVELRLADQVNYDHYVRQRQTLLARIDQLQPASAPALADPELDLSHLVPVIMGATPVEFAELLDILQVQLGMVSAGKMQVLQVVAPDV